MIIAQKNIKKIESKDNESTFVQNPGLPIHQWTTGETPPRFCSKVMPSNPGVTRVPLTPRVHRENLGSMKIKNSVFQKEK